MAMVYFSSAAERDLKHLPREVQDSLQKDQIPQLVSNPRIGKSLHGPLRGCFSYDFHIEGISYRIAYEITKDNVIISMIGARENFYKKLSRRIR